jgi:diguanylate cyclase (GGDEF)-like protein/PAS domain S-box-containing protein
MVVSAQVTIGASGEPSDAGPREPEQHAMFSVLLIEDNEADAYLVRDSLANSEPGRFKITQSDRLASGLACLSHENFDLVLLDLSLPDSDGFETFRRVRESSPSTPIVVLTGRDDHDLAIMTTRAGGQDYLLKQFSGGELLTRLMQAIERKRVEEALRESEERYRLLFEMGPHPMWVLDTEDLRFLAVNPAATQLYGYSEAEFLNLRVLDLVPTEAIPTIREWLVPAQQLAPLCIQHRKKDGGILHVEMTGVTLQLGGRWTRFAIVTDVTARWRAEQELEYQASHDALTSLCNRAVIERRMNQLIAYDGAENTRFAFLLLDLDQFKIINDSLGHHSGDMLLQRLSPKLRAAVRKTDTVARLGGDEFAILLPGATAEEAILVSKKIQKSLRTPILISNHWLDIGASIGIALYPEHGRAWEDLLQRADIAMYQAKRTHGGHLVYAEGTSDLSGRFDLMFELRKAIETDQLLLYFQPKIDLRTMRVDGVEALVRWPHPRRGLLAPDETIPVAEQSGLMKALTLWVLDAAVHQSCEWHRAGIELDMAVNLPPDTLVDRDFLQVLARKEEAANLVTARLILEITEATLVSEPERSRVALDQIHEMGVRISIDDFGTGYSSLAYLNALPVDELKIDQSLVRGMAANDRGECIVRTIVELGHNLGLQVVAEGVEGREDLESLIGLGCDHAQGFFFSQPLPCREFETWYHASEEARLRGNAKRPTVGRRSGRLPASSEDGLRSLTSRIASLVEV